MKITDLIEQLQYFKTAGATQVHFQDYNWNVMDVCEIKQLNDNVVIVVEENIDGEE